ncbi:eukaryotic translation initiation factor eIF2A-domain-containing protein [Vararia minispora EC-137]|uniref:Eukaryotic translation initiation factor eIF2A-domain-containing protein n=1 Tax=Vararia minispora EC-137 TaxID=1314806 RepID=A0ACB8QTK9_9AGAM|nr:eukaryotic translation initiation factor eIF2A-domain-containing protein [Vararia minispora EC-137]
MASQLSQQYAFRAQKSLGLVNGSPSYEPVEGFQAPSTTARTYQYSPDGRLFATALPSGVQIYQAEGATLLHDLALPGIVEIQFSPRGTYLSTWERPQKLEDGAQHKNLRIFSVSTGEELISFTQKGQEGWDVQYTISESHAIRLVGQEIQVFSPADWSKGVVDKLRVEGANSVTLSPGLNPSVAVFMPEKGGQPASVKIFSLLNLAAPPTCQKTFFGAEKSQIKWNTLGTQVLVLTQTDVDNTNKSYYGQTGLYLLSAVGNFDCRVKLDKEGPIHDFTWSPNSKEFGVVYGFMPAKAMLFDQRVRTLHDFGTSFYNHISFNPQSRLLFLAGFGNLAGKMDIFDRRSLTRVATIDAVNTSYCEWSPDGKFLLTATLSPRLRVDNGIKIWYILGQLVHVQMVDELYQAGWRPTPVDAAPAFPQVIPAPPTPSTAAAAALAEAKPVVLKPAGAYRPPGLRGQSASSAYKRDDEGGSTPGSGSATPTRQNHRGGAPNSNGRRYVPGAALPSSPSPGSDSGKRVKRKPGKDGKEGGKREQQAGVQTNGNGNGAAHAPQPTEAAQETVNADPGALDPAAKKIRNLNKKVCPALLAGGRGCADAFSQLKAIEELKEKQQRGERLEATQVKKIESEAEIRKELAALGE